MSHDISDISVAAFSSANPPSVPSPLVHSIPADHAVDTISDTRMQPLISNFSKHEFNTCTAPNPSFPTYMHGDLHFYPSTDHPTITTRNKRSFSRHTLLGVFGSHFSIRVRGVFCSSHVCVLGHVHTQSASPEARYPSDTARAIPMQPWPSTNRRAL